MKRYSANNYSEYKKAQIERSAHKWGSLTFSKQLAYFINLLDIFRKIDNATFKTIGCMGIRKGNEYDAFKEHINFKDSIVYGIDINPKVEKVGPNCYCKDFSNLPKQWENYFDIVYSNSLDHAFDVAKTISEWYRVCKKYLILTLATGTEVDRNDMYSFVKEDIDKLFDAKRFKVLWVEDSNDLTKFSIILSVIK